MNDSSDRGTNTLRVDSGTIRTKIFTLLPSQFTEAQRDALAALVRAGGEVAAEGLADRIQAAALLTFMYDVDRENLLCGVGALKTPTENYRSKIFARAEAAESSENYPRELGWLVVAPSHRNKQLSRRLVNVLLRAAGNAGVYATMRVENEPMRRTLLRFGFRPDGTHFQSEHGDYQLALYLHGGPAPAGSSANPFIARGQFHGSPERFESFEANRLNSLGFHFGDIEQAKHFARKSGYIYKADLKFENLLDIGSSDWGWTCAAYVAFALHTTCLLRGLPVQHAEFAKILGPGEWSLNAIKKTPGISNEEQATLVALFRAHGFDGVRYLIQCEPPGRTGRVAYFVTDPKQIQLRDITQTQEPARADPHG